MTGQPPSESRSIGLALGMGGARGWGHIGVLRGLDEIGVPVDRVSGCSMGALVGAAWAAGQLDALEDWARNLTRAGFLGYLDLRLSGGGLVAGHEVARLLDRLEIPQTFQDLDHPFSCVATDLATGREMWFDRGPVRDAIRASVSIPGIFAPQRHKAQWLVDGALVDPVPVSGARALGAGPVVGVDPNGLIPGQFWTPPKPSESPSNSMIEQLWERGTALGGWLFGPDAEKIDRQEPLPPNVMDVVWAAVDIMTASVMRMRLASSPPDLMLEIPLREMGVMEFYHAADAIAEGRRKVIEEADALRALVA